MERDGLVAEAMACQSDIERQNEIQTMANNLGPTLVDLSLAKGRAEGRAEGQWKGELLSVRVLLQGLLKDRFGFPRDGVEVTSGQRLVDFAQVPRAYVGEKGGKFGVVLLLRHSMYERARAGKIHGSRAIGLIVDR